MNHHRRYSRRLTRGDDGSLPMAVLLTVVGVALSTTLLTVVVGQMSASGTSGDRVRALHAAEAGIDAAMAQIRAATDSTGYGALQDLPPCEIEGALSAGPAAGPPRYRVTITYRDGAGAAMACPPLNIPATARLEATGTGVPGGALDVGAEGTRTIGATYSFRATNTNIPGGLVRYNGNNLCLDAGTVLPPPAGSPVRVNTCQPGAARQRFAYDEKLRLRLIDAQDPAALGMCVTGDADTTGTDVTFTPCADAERKQVWSLDDSSRFRGLKSPPAANPQRCLAVRSPVGPMMTLTISNCGSANQTFRADDEVGAGRAGSEEERLITGQIVNYEQFGRCLDVTDFVWNRPYMIAWFCKQEPAPAVVRWNQRWTMPAAGDTGRILTVNDENAAKPHYCLRSPGTTNSQSFVTLSECTATGALEQALRWTVYGDTGNYATAYQIVDGYGYCLTPTDLDNPYPNSRHSDGTAKIKVAVCDGSDIQKWNARPDLKQPTPLTDFTER